MTDLFGNTTERQWPFMLEVVNDSGEVMKSKGFDNANDICAAILRGVKYFEVLDAKEAVHIRMLEKNGYLIAQRTIEPRDIVIE